MSNAAVIDSALAMSTLIASTSGAPAARSLSAAASSARLIAGHHRHRSTLGRKAFGDGQSHALAATGDDGGGAAQTKIHSCRPLVVPI